MESPGAPHSSVRSRLADPPSKSSTQWALRLANVRISLTLPTYSAVRDPILWKDRVRYGAAISDGAQGAAPVRLVLLGVVLPAMTCMARSGLPVSTTRDAGLRFKHRRYRYQIDLSRNPDIVNLSRNPDRNRTGTDVNATIEKQMEGGLLPRDWRNYKPREREVAVVGSIDPLAVVRVYDYVEDRTGTWNPGANEVDWVPGDPCRTRQASGGPLPRAVSRPRRPRCRRRRNISP